MWYNYGCTIDILELEAWSKIVTGKADIYYYSIPTDRDGNQEANRSVIDHCDLKNMYIMLNQDRYPAVDYNLSFPNQQFSRAYLAAATLSEKFYGMDELVTQSNITPAEFKDLFPIMVFDVSSKVKG